MKYHFDGFNWVIRLEKGEKLIVSLKELVKREAIQGAWVSGLGAALQTELGYYSLEKKEYQWKTIDETLEITNLQGNVGWADGEPAIHIHGTFSDEHMQAIGGHVKELVVGGTCEIMLHALQVKLTRSLDDATGLKLLDL